MVPRNGSFLMIAAISFCEADAVASFELLGLPRSFSPSDFRRTDAFCFRIWSSSFPVLFLISASFFSPAIALTSLFRLRTRTANSFSSPAILRAASRSSNGMRKSRSRMHAWQLFLASAQGSQTMDFCALWPVCHRYTENGREHTRHSSPFSWRTIFTCLSGPKHSAHSLGPEDISCR